jgi:tetratricopeptide (TPR) repeat protein
MKKPLLSKLYCSIAAQLFRCCLLAFFAALCATPLQAQNVMKAYEYFTKGNNAQGNNFHELAIEYYQKTIAIDPNNAAAYSNMGNAHYKLGNKQEGIKNLQKVARLGNEDAQAWLRKNGYGW